MQNERKRTNKAVWFNLKSMHSHYWGYFWVTQNAVSPKNTTQTFFFFLGTYSYMKSFTDLFIVIIFWFDVRFSLLLFLITFTVFTAYLPHCNVVSCVLSSSFSVVYINAQRINRVDFVRIWAHGNAVNPKCLITEWSMHVNCDWVHFK